MPKTVILEDDGLFLLAGYFNGVAHLPGYPLYTLTAHLASQIPLGSVAARIHALTGLYGAIAVGLLWFLILHLRGKRTLAYLAAFSFAFSGAYWSQAIIAEVYTLNMVFFLSLLYLLLTLHSNQRGKILLIGIVAGLGLSLHWPLFILASIALFPLLWKRRETLLYTLHHSAFGLMIGLLPLVWLYVRSGSDTMINFYGPLQGWSDFWYFLSREGSASADYSSSADWRDRLLFAGFFFREFARQFTYFGFLFSVIGFVVQWRRLSFETALSLTLAFLTGSLLLISLLQFDYDLLHQAIFRVYPLIPYAMAAIWLGLGIEYVIGKVTHYTPTSRKWLTPALTLLLPILVLLYHLPNNYRHGDTVAKEFATELLNLLPQNAVLFAESDMVAAPAGYLHYIENLRSDITIISRDGLVFDTRLFLPLHTTDAQRQKRIKQFVDNTERPICSLTEMDYGYNYENHGLFRCIYKESTINGTRGVYHPQALHYLARSLVKPYDPDIWNTALRRAMERRFAHYLILTQALVHDPEQQRLYRQYERVLQKRYYGILGLVEARLLYAREAPKKLLPLLDRAEDYLDQVIEKKEHSQLYNLRARLLQRMGRETDAVRAYRQAWKVWPHTDNPAQGHLQGGS